MSDMVPEKITLRLPGGFNLPPFGIHQVLALVIVCVALWALGTMWLGMQVASQWVGSWQDEIRVHVYLDGQETGQATALEDELATIDGVASVAQISPQQAAEWMQQWLGDTGLDRTDLEARLPITFELFLAPESSQFLFADIRDVAKKYRAKVNEEEVGLAQAHRWLAQVQYLVWFASIVLALAMALIISNTLRMTLLARADEIHLMRLLGAKEWFVRMPFILEGTVLGAGAGVAAWLLLWPLVLIASDWLEALGVDPQILVLLLPLAIGGAIVGSLGALVATAQIVAPEVAES